MAVCLLLTGQSLNAISLLGMVVMGGIVVNNGILFVTVANQGLREGKTAMQTAVTAAQLRLRPILMTSATTVLGMLPMAIGLGEGAELNAPLAIVVIGGMLSSTPLVVYWSTCAAMASRAVSSPCSWPYASGSCRWLAMASRRCAGASKP